MVASENSFRQCCDLAAFAMAETRRGRATAGFCSLLGAGCAGCAGTNSYSCSFCGTAGMDCWSIGMTVVACLLATTMSYFVNPSQLPSVVNQRVLTQLNRFGQRKHQIHLSSNVCRAFLCISKMHLDPGDGEEAGSCSKSQEINCADVRCEVFCLKVSMNAIPVPLATSPSFFGVS